MPSLKLSNPFRRNACCPSLRERAAALKATAGRVLRRPAALPAPGSDAARDAFAAACREHSRLTVFAREGYPELMRTRHECWTKDSLDRALDTGEVSPADYARLYPIASQRELRVEAITHRLNIGALHALAYADSYPQEAAQPEVDEADAALIALGLALEASEQRERAEEIEGNATTDDAARRAADARIDAACAETAAILERLATMPAHTAEGLRVKLRAIRHGLVSADGPAITCRVFRSLLRDAGLSEADLAAAAEG